MQPVVIPGADSFFFFISTMYVQLKKLMASKYSSSVCGGYMCVSNLNTKVWGFCFLSSCVFSLFVWLSECSCGQTGLLFFFPPPLPEWSQMHQRCQSLRVPQPWENHIYGNGKSIKHLSYCSPCSVCIYVLRIDFVSSGWKNVKNTLLFFFFFFCFFFLENDNIWVLDFEIRSLNMKKKKKL